MNIPFLKNTTFYGNISAGAGTSNDWNSVYSSVNSVSGTWDSSRSTVNSLSSFWNSIFYENTVFALKTSNFDAKAYNNYIVNSTTQRIDCNLPQSPSIGDSIMFLDSFNSWATYPFVINNNGKRIESLNEGLTANVAGFNFSLVYTDEPFGWRLYK